ncbi:THUMP domain-containing class I SAM-dependent RNA methyltransferase [Desulfatirhabdium butyrativorans]|uniref:THUMP domain-containing class I SAM-dependent RNA methyltransferase n=1 Tax=Desulfatirhabdium butyrativorans TaxID=340467 RepID=UPI00041D285A|nr:THUMP domain-containing protein [Desulfatirhabdium butyrativorans]
MYLYQQDRHFFAQIARDLIEIGVAELESLGATDIHPDHRGIRFQAEEDVLYAIVYNSRLITRVLAPLIRFRCTDTNTLYNIASKIEWRDFFSTDHTFAVFANVNQSRIGHSQFAALRLKDAVADAFRKQCQKRPNVDPETPDVWINLHIEKDVATISLDLAGESLHKRGYRMQKVSAPLQETLAAGILAFTGWDGRVPLIDPMCGSGTFLAEALMRYCRIPAGFFRKRFGFEFLPDFSKRTWQRVRQNADAAIRELPEGLISGSDIAKQAVLATRTNVNRLPYGKQVDIVCRDIADMPEIAPSVIVINPPYGIRMGQDTDLAALYKQIGDILKQRCQGSTAYIFAGDRRLLGSIGLRSAWKKIIETGGLDGRLAKYELF